MPKNNFYDDENGLDYERDDYSYSDYNDEDDFEGYKKRKQFLESEYDTENDYDFDDEDNEKHYQGNYDDEDDEDIDIKNRLNMSDEDEELLRELDELDEDNFESDSDDEEERPKKRKRRKKGEAKQENMDMSGSAVRNRFYEIMNDYHSGNNDKRQDALARAMKELEGFIHLIIKRSYSTYTKKYFYDLLQEGYLGVAIGM